jgi:hypothetical protein
MSNLDTSGAGVSTTTATAEVALADPVLCRGTVYSPFNVEANPLRYFVVGFQKGYSPYRSIQKKGCFEGLDAYVWLSKTLYYSSRFPDSPLLQRHESCLSQNLQSHPAESSIQSHSRPCASR